MIFLTFYAIIVDDRLVILEPTPGVLNESSYINASYIDVCFNHCSSKPLSAFQYYGILVGFKLTRFLLLI